MNWAKDLGVKEFDETTEVLYFPCCYPSYDPRLKKVSQATATILTKAGVDFGILGSKEMCCGESVRKAVTRPYSNALPERTSRHSSTAG